VPYDVNVYDPETEIVIPIWGVSALRETAKDFEYGVFPLPLPPKGDARTVLGGWAFVANAKGKNPEEAAKFCVWALGSKCGEGEIKFYLDGDA
jgi:ABC-type glycerol-3-phosphate transport system substrate-binding protein